MKYHRGGTRQKKKQSNASAMGTASSSPKSPIASPVAPQRPPTPIPALPPAHEDTLFIASCAVATIEDFLRSASNDQALDTAAISAAPSRSPCSQSELWPPPTLPTGQALPVRGGWPVLPPEAAPAHDIATWARLAGESLQDYLDALSQLTTEQRARRKDLLSRLNKCLDAADALRQEAPVRSPV